MGVKGVAFLKELFVAHRFGTSDEVDAFLMAMLIPAVVSYALGNAFRDALIPIYAERRLNDRKSAERLVASTLWYCLAMLSALSVVSFILAGPIMSLVAGSFPEEKIESSALYFQIVLPYTVCVGVAGVLKGYLQAQEKFLAAAAAPVLIPGTTIVILAIAPGEPNGAWLAWGTGGGSILMFLVLFFSSYRIKGQSFVSRPKWDEATKLVLKSAGPLLASTIVIESYLFVDTLMVAPLAAGSVATLSYGERICGVFCIVGATVAQAMFPHVSDLVAKKDWVELKRMVKGFSGWSVLISLPVVLAFWFLAEPIVRIIFERGEFTQDDTKKVAAVLQFAGLQVPGSILLTLAARVVMALRGNHYVIFSAIVGLIANIGLNILFIDLFGVRGVALSTAGVNLLSTALLFWFAAHRIKQRQGKTE